MTKKEQFIIFIRTEMFWKQRFKGENDVFIHVPQSEIYNKWFVKKSDLSDLVNSGQLEIKTVRTKSNHDLFMYKVLTAGAINPLLIEPRPSAPMTAVHNRMLAHLGAVSLKDGAEATQYFEVFLKCFKLNPRLFFVVDRFSGRVHTPVTSYHRHLRHDIFLNGEPTKSLDVVTMQPLLLGKILLSEIGTNDFSTWINSGKDIYIMLQERAKLSTRDEAKKLFFQILFGKPNNQLESMFGGANWIEWINDMKSKPMLSNPHTEEKNYSNLAWLLQSTEVNIMYQIWESLPESMVFLSVHDEILVTESDFKQASEIFNSVMSHNFTYFKTTAK